MDADILFSILGQKIYRLLHLWPQGKFNILILSLFH